MNAKTSAAIRTFVENATFAQERKTLRLASARTLLSTAGKSREFFRDMREYNGMVQKVKRLYLSELGPPYSRLDIANSMAGLKASIIKGKYCTEQFSPISLPEPITTLEPPAVKYAADFLNARKLSLGGIALKSAVLGVVFSVATFVIDASLQLPEIVPLAGAAASYLSLAFTVFASGALSYLSLIKYPRALRLLKDALSRSEHGIKKKAD
jgi:hypothetical protein